MAEHLQELSKDKLMYWALDRLSPIGGMDPVIKGTPKITNVPDGKAIEFSGNGDGLFFRENPLDGLKEFTIELRFRPDKGGLPEQRFFHFGYATGNRVLFETRLTESGKWFLDTFVASGESECTLFNSDFLHPVDYWYHLALSCDGSEQVNYVDGQVEQRGTTSFKPIDGGELSIGVRLNQVCWFNGAIAEVSISPKSLEPADFSLL